MNAAIVSIVFTCVAVAGAIFASPKGKFGKYSIAAVWVFAATLAFIIPSNLVVLSLLFVVLGIVAVRSKENRYRGYLFWFLPWVAARTSFVILFLYGLDWALTLSLFH